MEFSVEAPMDDIEDIKASTKETSMGEYTTASMEVTFTKASVEDFMEVTEPFVEVMETFIEVMSTEVFMEAFVDNTKGMKASTGNSTKASTKASMEVTSSKSFTKAFIEVMEAFADVTEAFLKFGGRLRRSFHERYGGCESFPGCNVHGSFLGRFLKLPWKLPWKVYKI